MKSIRTYVTESTNHPLVGKVIAVKSTKGTSEKYLFGPVDGIKDNNDHVVLTCRGTILSGDTPFTSEDIDTLVSGDIVTQKWRSYEAYDRY